MVFTKRFPANHNISKVCRMFKALKYISLCVIITFLQCGVGFTQTRTLTILHTNDLHASFLPHDAAWIQSDPKPLVGGFKELWWMVDSIRKAKTGSSVLLLDGGDVMTGSPISEMDYKGSTGGAIFEMLNGIGYDAWTVGNHDLDISQDNLREHAKIASFPTLSANLRDSSDRLAFNNVEYVILRRGELRIGIIGIITRDLFSVTNTNNLHGVKVASPVATTQSVIDKISGETDLLIALTHQGVDEDSLLAASTHGLQIIIGAHSHTRLKSPKNINGVIICQAGSNCENLGELELTLEGKTIKQYNGKLLPLWTRAKYPENEFTKLIDEYRQEVDKEYGEVLGQLIGDWKRDGRGESGIGNFVVDAMRESAGADIALTNSSGIRKDLHSGPIKKLDLFEISPFRNVLCTFTLSGKEVKEMAQRYAAAMIEGKSSIQLSGMTSTWKRSNGSAMVQDVRVGGDEVKDDRIYTCATSDFVVNQGSKYLGITPTNVHYTTTTILQTLVARVQKEKTVHSQVENRIRELQ